MTAAWEKSCNYRLFRSYDFLFRKRCGGGRMGRGSSSIWIRLLMCSDMYCFPFLVLLNVKLMLNMMSYKIYDRISNPFYHQYYMVFLLFLTWPWFGLQCYVCMEIQLHLQLKIRPSESFLCFCSDRLLLWSMVEVSQSTPINQHVACLVIFRML